MLSVSNHSCCGCNPDPCTNCPPRCKPITSADLADLIYIAGLDVNYCKKYQEVADVLGLVDCNGDPIVPGQPIVTCAQMQEQLCEIFSTFVSGGVLVPGTVVVGANCQTYTVPPFQSPLTVADTPCIDLTLAGNVLSANPIINTEDATNVLECTADGLYVPSLCEQLLDVPLPAVPAGPGAILVTRGCVAVDLSAFQQTITVQDTPCLDLTFAGNVLSGAPVISPNAGNQLSCAGNGLFVPADAPETPITVIDTTTVNLTVSGVNNHTLQADVIVSPDAGNTIEVHPNGLYVPDVCEQFSDIVGVVTPATAQTVFVTRDCDLVSLPTAQVITVDDTVTVDLTLAAGEITADVNISPNAGNQIQVLGNGLYVPSSVTDVTITGVDTNCIDTTVIEGPANVFSVSAAPIISPAVGNQLSCTPAGLFVPATANPVTCNAIQGLFPPSGDTLASGDEVLVGPDCETRTFPTFSAADTACINTTVTINGNGDYLFSADPIVAAAHPGYLAPCNGLVCGVGGLSAPPDIDGLTLTTPILPDSYNGATVDDQVIVIPPVSLPVTNPSDCRQAILLLAIRVPEIQESQTGVVPNRLEIDLQHSSTFPSNPFGITPVTSWAIQHMSATDVPGTRTAAGMIINAFVMQPGETGVYTGYLTVTQTDGSLTNLRIDPVVLRAFLYTI